MAVWKSLLVAGISGIGCVLALFWLSDGWKIADWVVTMCVQDEIQVVGYEPTTAREACQAATAWATYIEELRYQPHRPGEAANLRRDELALLGWHNVESRFDVYQPTADLLGFLSLNTDTELNKHGPISIHANFVPAGPTCVRVYAGNGLSTANCVSMRGDRYESWRLCTP